MLGITFNVMGLRILFWNADGVHNKQSELENLVSDLNIDIIALNETRLTGRLVLQIPGFSCYRADRRSDGAGQGVAIMARADIDHSPIDIPLIYNLEAVGIRLQLANGNISLYSVYQSPNLPLFTMLNDIKALMNTGARVLVMGDLNAKHPYWSPGSANHRGNLVYELMLHDEVIVHAPSDPTLVHYRSEHDPSTPDLLLTQNVHTIQEIKTIHALSSNHLPVLVRLTTQLRRQPITKLNYAKANWDRFRSIINSSITLNNSTLKSAYEVDTTISHLQDTIIAARDSTVPVSTLKPWESSLPRNIKRKIKHKNQLRRYSAKETDSTFRETLKLEIKKYQYEINAALKLHGDEVWNRKLRKVDNPGTDLWRIARGLRSNSLFTIPPLKANDGTKASTDKDKSELLANSFSENMLLTSNWDSDEKQTVDTSINQLDISPLDKPLLVRPLEIKKCIDKLKSSKAPGPDKISNHLIKNLPQKAVVLLTKVFNACLMINYFPTVWKAAKVIAIHKPGKDPTDPSGYRPISLLPCLGKLFEKIIHHRLHRAADAEIIDEQFGFREAHSTTQQLARVAEAVSHGLNIHESTGMFLLDIEKAFDTVWHKALLHKLIKLGVPLSLTNLIRSYLSCRSFTVHIGNSSSRPKLVLAGVPQGSILGPQLFILYINDIPIQTRTTLACFADDTASLTSSKDTDLVISRLQLSLDLLSSYFQKWKLKINASKTEAIMFTRHRSLPPRTLKIDGYAIPWSRSVKYLGTVLDTKLNWSQNTQKLRLKGIKAMNALSPILNRKSCLSSSTKLSIYRTLVRPCITYACPVWSSTCTTNINKLQVIQNKALKFSYNTPICTNLSKLHVNIKFPILKDFIFKISKKFYLHSISKNKNKLINNICKTRKKNLQFIDSYNRYKLPHHLFLECNE